MILYRKYYLLYLDLNLNKFCSSMKFDYFYHSALRYCEPMPRYIRIILRFGSYCHWHWPSVSYLNNHDIPTPSYRRRASSSNALGDALHNVHAVLRHSDDILVAGVAHCNRRIDKITRKRLYNMLIVWESIRRIL